MTLVEILDRPITFQRSFVRITKSVSAAVFLSQAVFWTQRSPLPDGWFSESRESWEEATGMDATKQARARKILLDLDVVEEQEGSMRVVSDALRKRLTETPALRIIPGSRVTPERRQLPVPDPVAVAEIYQLYPRKVAVGAAKKAIVKALQRASLKYPPPQRMEQAVEVMRGRVGLYAMRTKGSDLTLIPYPATWFNQERYDDPDDLWSPMRKDGAEEEPEEMASAPKGRGWKSAKQAEEERAAIIAKNEREASDGKV